MPGKREEKVSDLTIRVLREIRDEAKKTNQCLDRTNEQLDQANERLEQTNARLDSLTVEMRQGFDQLGRRIDNVLLGEHRREHEELRERVERIEQHLGLEPF